VNKAGWLVLPVIVKPQVASPHCRDKGTPLVCRAGAETLLQCECPSHAWALPQSPHVFWGAVSPKPKLCPLESSGCETAQKDLPLGEDGELSTQLSVQS
jgi:hypothetical protein